MGLMDNMDMDSIKARIQELSQKDEKGQLDDNGRQELSMLKSKIKM